MVSELDEKSPVWSLCRQKRREHPAPKNKKGRKKEVNFEWLGCNSPPIPFWKKPGKATPKQPLQSNSDYWQLGAIEGQHIQCYSAASFRVIEKHAVPMACLAALNQHWTDAIHPLLAFSRSNYLCLLGNVASQNSWRLLATAMFYQSSDPRSRSNT